MLRGLSLGNEKDYEGSQAVYVRLNLYVASAVQQMF